MIAHRLEGRPSSSFSTIYRAPHRGERERGREMTDPIYQQQRKKILIVISNGSEGPFSGVSPRSCTTVDSACIRSLVFCCFSFPARYALKSKRERYPSSQGHPIILSFNQSCLLVIVKKQGSVHSVEAPILCFRIARLDWVGLHCKAELSRHD